MPPGRLYGLLGIGVVAVSLAAPLIKVADAPPLSIAAYRLALSGAPLMALAAWRNRQELARLSTGDRRAIALAGLCLAAHFATWVASLRYGSVASSVALVTTSPLFVAGFAFIFTGERTSRLMLGAIVLCTAGGLVIGAADWAAGRRELFADALALSGAGFAAAYYALGRRVRARISVVTYAALVYFVAGAALVAGAAVARQPLTGFSGRTYLIFACLAIVPQLIGHSALNWALGYLSAPFVSIAVLGEPVLATLLAAVFLREMPGVQRVAGGMLLLAGVYVALRDERRRAGSPAARSLGTEVG